MSASSLVAQRHTRRCWLSTEEQVEIGQMLIGLSVLPFLAGVATAAQPTLLSNMQMDNVTAGQNVGSGSGSSANTAPAGFVTSTVQIPTIGGSIPVQITYAIYAECPTCAAPYNADLGNAALAALLPPNP